MTQTFLAKRPHETYKKYKMYMYGKYVLINNLTSPTHGEKIAMCRTRRMKGHYAGLGCNDMSRT